MEYKQTYERIVPRICVGKYLAIRFVAYLGYVCFALLWVAPIIRSLFQPTLIALAVLTTVILVLITKKYLHVEYEYSFVEDMLTVSKIFGKRRRKTVMEIHLKKMLLVSFATDEAMEDATRYDPTTQIDVRSSPESENALLIVWSEDSDTRVLLLLESDEQTVAFFRRHAPHACTRELKNNFR